ncbi:MAG TPA: RodZ domain-containing protein [Candidatus Binatia bacterium]|nr:RodZ domain-containing protein [Candidatus Binatia bacterium]
MNEQTADAETTSAADAAPAPGGPGALLRQARERAGMSVEDVSSQLKLARNTLEALERDDFRTLSEAVYVRGYYRKIAKVLPVTEAELLAAYENLRRPREALLPQRIPLAGGVAAGSSRRTRGQGIGVVVLTVIVLAVLFLMVDDKPARRPVAAPVASAPQAENAAATPQAPATVSATSPAPAGPAVSPVVTAPAPATGVTPPATTAAPASASGSQLRLEFSASSFVRVEDARGKTLAIGLVRAGEGQSLEGQPPYTVFLGNAQNAKVFFDGQPFDFSPHVNRQNDTARFTVP